MVSLDLRKSVLEYVKNADHRFLRLVKALAETYINDAQTVAYTVDGKPLTRQGYNQELLNAEMELQRGELTSQEDIEKEAQNW